jgi:predicted DCC family thiol-disulfide oxidoreductase YuxK
MGSVSTPATSAQPVFVYDGDCAFCSTCARFILRRIPTPAHVAAWQHVDIAALGLTEDECDTAVQWVGTDIAGRRRQVSGPAAIADLLRSSGGIWRGLGRVLALRPVLAAAGPVYRFVARHRDRMPGGTAACALPNAERVRLRATAVDGVARPAPDASTVAGISLG